MFIILGENFGIAEITGLITAIGAISGVVIFFFGKKKSDATADANLDKVSAETRKIEQEIESKYVEQIQHWVEELKEISIKHNEEVRSKDKDIARLHRQNLENLNKLEEFNHVSRRTARSYQKLMANMSTAYWETDAQGQLRYANGAWLLIFGLREEQALGEKWLSCIPEDKRDGLLVDWYSRVTDSREDTPIELEIVNALSGEHVKLKSIYSIIHDSGGNVSKIIGVTVRV